MTDEKTEQSPENGAPFEQSLRELEELVERLELGEVSLEDSLKDFERGVKLAQELRKRLDAAQLRVAQVLEKEGGKIEAQELDLEEE